MNDEVYGRLIDRMNLNVVSHHNTQARRNYMKEFYTEEQATLVADFPLGAFTPKALAEKMNRDGGELKAMLEQMKEKDLIFEAKNEAGELEYSVFAWEPGWSEIQGWRRAKYPPDEETEKRLVELRQKMAEEDQAVTQAFLKNPEAIEEAKKGPTIARLVPIEETVAGDKQLASFEKISELIEMETTFAVAECGCKVGARERGEPCQSEAPIECCLWFGKVGEYLIEKGYAEQYTKEQTYEMLKKCQDTGLVQFTMNRTVSENIVVCNCCKCCCYFLKAHNSMLENAGMPIIQNTNFVSTVDEDTCTGCEECVDHCQLEAISMNDNDIASVNEQRCLGCGACVDICPTESLSLSRISDQQPPELNIPIVGSGV